MRYTKFNRCFRNGIKQFGVALGVAAVFAAPGPALAGIAVAEVSVAVAKIDVERGEGVEPDEVFDWVIDDLWVLAVRRSFDREYSYTRAPRDVRVVHTDLKEKWQESDLTDARSHFIEMGVDIGIVARLRVTRRGSLLKVVAMNVREESRSYSGMEVFGSDTGYEEIETKLRNLSEELAEGFRRGMPDQGVRVLVSCFRPAELEFQRAALKLTLELPYALNVLSEQRDMSFNFVGLTTNDYYYRCGQSSFQTKMDAKNYLELEQYDYKISGTIFKNSRRTLGMKTYADSPRSNHITPLDPIIFPDEIDDEVIGLVAADLLDRLTAIDTDMSEIDESPSTPTLLDFN